MSEDMKGGDANASNIVNIVNNANASNIVNDIFWQFDLISLLC